MSKLLSSLKRTSVFLVVAIALQGCGEEHPEDDTSTAPDILQGAAQPSESPDVELSSTVTDAIVTVSTTSLTDAIVTVGATPAVPNESSTHVSGGESVDEVPVAATALPVNTLEVATEASSTLSVDVVDSRENEQSLTDGNGGESVDLITSQSNDVQQIILGNRAGDAVCLHLGDEDKGFGNVEDSDWKRWVSEFHFSIGEEFLAVEPQDDGSAALRQRFIPSSIGTDRAVVGARLPASRTYRLTQSFYFEPGFDWGGKYEGGKLGFGFAGGTRPTGGTIDPNGFSSRLMWRGNGDGTGRIVLYSYAADRSDKFGEDYRYGDGNVPIGEWFSVTMEVTTNSSTQKSDGVVRGWINDELVLDRQNVGWQLAGNTPVVDYLYYSGFYGGNSTDWSPSSTTHMKTRDVCWAAVVDGYSGIDPDNGRLLVATTENPNELLADTSENAELEANFRERQRALVGISEESLTNIRSVAPVASLLTQRLYDDAIAELTAIVINTDQVTDRSLSVNPVPLLKNAADQLEFAFTLNEGNEVQRTAITGVQEALRFAALRSSELAIAVVENAMSISSCSDIISSPNCGVANEILLEISSLLENTQSESTSIDDIFITAEAIWNRSVDALNALD